MGRLISVWRDREQKGWRRCVVEVGGGGVAVGRDTGHKPGWGW